MFENIFVLVANRCFFPLGFFPFTEVFLLGAGWFNRPLEKCWLCFVRQVKLNNQLQDLPEAESFNPKKRESLSLFFLWFCLVFGEVWMIDVFGLEIFGECFWVTPCVGGKGMFGMMFQCFARFLDQIQVFDDLCAFHSHPSPRWKHLTFLCGNGTRV